MTLFLFCRDHTRLLPLLAMPPATPVSSTSIFSTLDGADIGLCVSWSLRSSSKLTPSSILDVEAVEADANGSSDT